MTLERIRDRAELVKYLAAAMQLEHSTIPPYLTALYSIHQGSNPEATSALRVVVVEEMLHLTLVANIINAIGGTVDLTGPDFVPRYPTHLPDGEVDFEVSVAPLTQAAIETFMLIERPGTNEEPREHVHRFRSPRAFLPSFRHHDGHDLHFFSIGEFYAEIERGLRELEGQLAARGETLFVGDLSRQVSPGDYFSDTGPLGIVRDLDSALLAIDFITEQGEGLGERIFGEFGELGHYYRLEQLLLGRAYQPGDVAGLPTGRLLDIDWDAVHPLIANATWDDYPEGSGVRAVAQEFDDAYRDFLRLLTEAYSGQPKLLDGAFAVMFQLRDLFGRLATTPVPDRPGQMAAPVFS